MEKIDIEFKESGTGSYSPWHLELADKYEIGLIGTADMGNFCKIGDDIYKIYYPFDYRKLYQYFCMLEEMNDKGEITDEEVLKEIDNIINNKNKDFELEKCIPLKEFEEQLITLKKKQDERETTHTTSV